MIDNRKYRDTQRKRVEKEEHMKWKRQILFFFLTRAVKNICKDSRLIQYIKNIETHHKERYNLKKIPSPVKKSLKIKNIKNIINVNKAESNKKNAENHK